MPVIDLLLNLAALLLWMNWRSVQFDPSIKAMPATLTGTLRRAVPSRLRRWHFPAMLAALLVFRGLAYWELGSAVDWTPNLRLGAITVWFRSDSVWRMFLFSGLGFAMVLAVFYCGLLLLSLANGSQRGKDPIQRLVSLYLGPIDAWAWQWKLLLPWIGAAVFWLLAQPILVNMKIILPAASLQQRIEQAVVIGLGVYLSWKFFIGGLLALSLVGSYIYFGQHPFWAFVSSSARNLVAPLAWLPLKAGKLDFTPLVVIALVFLGAESAERGLTALYGRLPL